MKPAGSSFAETPATGGMAPAFDISSFHRLTPSPFGTGGHGRPSFFACLRNTSSGARTFFGNGM